MFSEPLDLILDRDGIRHEYRRFCEHRKQHPREYPTVQDFAGALWLVCGIVAARLLFNAVFRKPVQHLLERRKLPAQRQEVYKLLEEIWVTLGGTVLMVWAIYVATHGLGECSLWNRKPCLLGWPFLPAPAILKMYYNVELAWYLHLLPKYRLGYGERDSIDMKAHHVATIALILGSYAVYIHLIGVLVLCIFNISNPLLHLAKIARQLHMRDVRAVIFVVFAIVFMLSRVVILPLTIMRYVAYDYQESMPHAREDFPWYILAFNVGLVALYILNLIWMRSIISILLHARSSGFQKAGHMAHKHDPTARANAQPELLNRAEKAGDIADKRD